MDVEYLLHSVLQTLRENRWDGERHHSFLHRNIADITPKIVYFCYQKNYVLGSKYPKRNKSNFEKSFTGSRPLCYEHKVTATQGSAHTPAQEPLGRRERVFTRNIAYNTPKIIYLLSKNTCSGSKYPPKKNNFLKCATLTVDLCVVNVKYLLLASVLHTCARTVGTERESMASHQRILRNEAQQMIKKQTYT